MAFLGPYFDAAGRFRLCALAPCFFGDAVIGVLGVRLDGYTVSRWIRHLSLPGAVGFTLCL